MFGQHSVAYTSGILILLTMQIAIIFAIVSQKFGATPPYDRCRRGVMMIVQVSEQIFAATYHSVCAAVFHLWFLQLVYKGMIAAQASHFWQKLASFVRCPYLLSDH